MKKSVKQSTMVIVLNAISILFVIATVLSLLYLRELSNINEKANSERFELTFNANRFMDGSAYLTNEVRAYAATGDKVHYNNYWNEINVLKNRDIGVARLKEIGITPEEQGKIDEMAALSNNLVPLESDAMDLRMGGMADEAIEAVFGKPYEDTISRIRAVKSDFLTMLDQRSGSYVDEINARHEFSENLTLLFAFIVAAIQLLNIILVMGRLILPIKKLEKIMGELAKGNLSSEVGLSADSSEIGMLTASVIQTKAELKKYIGDISEKLESIAGGNLDQDVDIDYIGDFAPIKESLTTIFDSLNETIYQINSTSRQVAEGTRLIAHSAQALSQGSVEQSETVEKLSQSTGDIAEKTKANASMAGKAAKLADTIRGNAEKGSRQMGDMMGAVKEINEASQSISKVIKTIDDIAFQTNILALNAAVEAARAGQHGKGFAVVAEEVRNLAAKSAEAARDTGSLIANSMEKAELGSRIASDTASSFSDIVSGISESAQIVYDIAKSSEEQSHEIEMINSGINQVSQVVQQNSATAEEEASAAQEMSGQSSVLEDLIASFSLRDAAPVVRLLHRRGIAG